MNSANNFNAEDLDSSLKEQTYQEEFKENNSSPNNATQPPTQKSSLNQVPLRFLMNPFGKVRDITSVSDSFNIETGLLSPNKCAELVTALQTQKGKGNCAFIYTYMNIYKYECSCNKYCISIDNILMRQDRALNERVTRIERLMRSCFLRNILQHTYGRRLNNFVFTISTIPKLLSLNCI